MPGSVTFRDDAPKRLSLVEGRLRGLTRILDEDTYCIDVLTPASTS